MEEIIEKTQFHIIEEIPEGTLAQKSRQTGFWLLIRACGYDITKLLLAVFVCFLHIKCFTRCLQKHFSLKCINIKSGYMTHCCRTQYSGLVCLQLSRYIPLLRVCVLSFALKVILNLTRAFCTVAGRKYFTWQTL